MKKLILFTLIIFSSAAVAQKWTAKQLADANTAKDIPSLSTIEIEIIMYINLARLFPKEFVKYEVVNYNALPKYKKDLTKSTYKASLIKELNALKPLNALVFDKVPYENARCLGEEQSKNGKTGHERTTCKDARYGENVSYGMDNSKDVVMQWLIDEDLVSLGHRKNCLSNSYTKIGVSEHTHTKYATSSIADFLW
ncbi:MAG: CAP domain-containing protein [Bacteroidota bacterium]|nr:CAP domain-containing protein [Bacteroidota bacterium]